MLNLLKLKKNNQIWLAENKNLKLSSNANERSEIRHYPPANKE